MENSIIDLEITTYTNEVGVSFVQAKGEKGDSGTTDHKFLTNLDYQNSAHTGFASSDDLNLKVDKELGKGLSANDLTDDIKAVYDVAAINSHVHLNKSALDDLSGVNTGDQDLSCYATTTALSLKPTITSGSTVPVSTPNKTGDIYVDTTNYKTYIAKGNSSSTDWIMQNGSYVIPTLTSSPVNPADGATCWFGSFATPAIGAGFGGIKRIYVGRGGTISSCYISFFENGGSDETSSLFIRVNNTIDYLISDLIVNNATRVNIACPDLCIPISAGDYFEFKWVCPTWTTNPTSISMTTQVTVDL